jgi:hypothetical protein
MLQPQLSKLTVLQWIWLIGADTTCLGGIALGRLLEPSTVCPWPWLAMWWGGSVLLPALYPWVPAQLLLLAGALGAVAPARRFSHPASRFAYGMAGLYRWLRLRLALQPQQQHVATRDGNGDDGSGKWFGLRLVLLRCSLVWNFYDVRSLRVCRVHASSSRQHSTRGGVSDAIAALVPAVAALLGSSSVVLVCQHLSTLLLLHTQSAVRLGVAAVVRAVQVCEYCTMAALTACSTHHYSTQCITTLEPARPFEVMGMIRVLCACSSCLECKSCRWLGSFIYGPSGCGHVVARYTGNGLSVVSGPFGAITGMPPCKRF